MTAPDIGALTATLKQQAKVTPGGADALTRTEQVIKRFIWMPDSTFYSVMVLWTAYTHLLTQCQDLPIAPRLGVFSGSPGSGKTRTLEILSRLVANGQDVGSLTAAAMLRVIGAAAASDEPGASPVVLFPDEIDRTFSPDAPV